MSTWRASLAFRKSGLDFTSDGPSPPRGWRKKVRRPRGGEDPSESSLRGCFRWTLASARVTQKGSSSSRRRGSIRIFASRLLQMGPRLHEGDARRFVVRAAARIHPIFASRLLQMGPRLREGDGTNRERRRGSISSRWARWISHFVRRTNSTQLRGTFLSKNSSISRAISSPLSSSAKWPVSRRCNSAFGRSRKYARAPSAGKILSFAPQTMRAGG